MPRILNRIGGLLLIASTGFSEVLTTAQDYAVDSDVVLESAVKEIKSAPGDTINAIGDGIKYVKDETITAVTGLTAPFKKDLHEQAQRDGELAVENAWNSSNDILFRDYKLSKDIGNVLMTGIEAGDESNVDVSGFFKNIEFSPKTSAYYLPKLNHLFVLQTLDNILAIESVLADYQDSRRELMGHQVEIEAKFIEVSQKTLNELGFKWDFTKGTLGAANIAGDLTLPGQDVLNGALRTATGALGANTAASDNLLISRTAGSLKWNLTINALEQADDSDVLSAPRVVTRDGTTAIIQVGEEQMIPKSFDINNQDTSCYVEHADWDLEMIGVRLEVTPELREGGLIDLEITPKIKEIIGYDTYSAVPRHKPQLPNMTIPELSASLPYFRIREMATKVTVADGSTVGMGGLIYDKLETFRDKVPVLGSIPLIGRLFRSEGEKSVKRNLMIFVTATQVDIDGRKSSDIALKK